ncbi:MAG: MFS transporter [Chloroflexi bacterium]|nr:MAG: MFS transporter [Chloroflexota bacterium]
MSRRRTLWTLYAINFLNAAGMWFFLPLLPIFLGRKGGSAALVGIVFAAGLVANALVRYPAGWAADRIGTRAVLVAAMLGSAALFLAYLLPLPLGAFILVRFFHGAAQGAYWPAANGLLAEVTAREERGRAFGYMQATNMAGMLLGPAIGGFIALLNIGAVFVIAAALSAVTVIALATLPNVRAQATVEVPARAMHIVRRLLPLILLGAGTSYMIGAFDTIWSLYLTTRGASTFAVGLSFVAFALPATLFSGLAGSLGDRFGPRRFIVAGLTCTAFFAALYPFIASVPWLIGLGLVEGAFTILGVPSTMAEVSRLADPGRYARTQAVFQTVQTAVQIGGALVAGALFTLGPSYAFLSITAVCLLGAATAFVPRLASIRAVHETS